MGEKWTVIGVKCRNESSICFIIKVNKDFKALKIQEEKLDLVKLRRGRNWWIKLIESMKILVAQWTPWEYKVNCQLKHT